VRRGHGEVGGDDIGSMLLSLDKARELPGFAVRVEVLCIYALEITL